MLDHGGEEVEDFRVPRILRIRLVIVDQKLERRQEVLVENCISLISFLENICLHEFEYVSPHCFHRLKHRVVIRLLIDHSVRDLLAVKVIDLQQVLEDVPQVV